MRSWKELEFLLIIFFHCGAKEEEEEERLSLSKEKLAEVEVIARERSCWIAEAAAVQYIIGTTMVELP